MSNLKEVKQAVKQLSVKELAVFRDWFTKFDTEQWDKQFENDVDDRKLDALAKKALQHSKEGHLTEL